jgi:cytochrome c-type biogenesis protein CcmF
VIPAPYFVAEPLLFLAFLLLCLDFLLLSGKGTMTAFRSKAGSFAAFLGCLLVVTSYLLLTLAFVTDTFSLGEVYSYSSSSLSLAFKLGGPWISGNGSLLFIALLLSLLYFVYRVSGAQERSVFRYTTYRIMDVILIVFVLVPLLQSPFSEVVPAPPDGIGMSPLLQTFWVLIHPPVIFLGYVLVFFAFALLVSALITGQREQLRSRWYTCSLALAWLFLAVGIALGGYWSYMVLGWGGYWSWDPVETASLLPWLALTAYFHLPSPGNGRLRELTLMATFTLVLYATAVTRGGFSPSLHAFGASPVGYLFLGIALAFVLSFLFLSRKRDSHLPQLEVDLHSVSSLSFTIAFAAIVALLGVCFLGVTLPVLGGMAGIPFSVDGAFFTAACFPLILALAAAFIGCGSSLSREHFAGLLIISLAIGGICSLLLFPTPSPLADLGLPLLLVSGGIILLRLGSSLQKKYFSPRLTGRTLIHFSLILILLGVLISSAAETETLSVPVHEGSSGELFGTSVTVTDIIVYPGVGQIYYPSHGFVGPEYASLTVLAEVGNKEIHGQIPLVMSYYPQYGMFSVPSVISTPGRDYYLSIHPSNTSQNTLMSALMGMEAASGEVVLSMKVVPFIVLIWAGIFLMTLGMVVILAGELVKKR